MHSKWGGEGRKEQGKSEGGGGRGEGEEMTDQKYDFIGF